MKKYTLGIYYHEHQYAHDASVSLLDEKGKIIFAASEERFSRKKFDHKFPKKAIESMLKYTGIEKRDIKYVVRPAMDEELIDKRTNKFFEELAQKSHTEKALKIIEEKKAFENQIDVYLKKCFSRAKIFRVDHHLSHVAGAYYTCPWPEATLISVDAYGNFCTSIVAQGSNGEIKIFDETLIPNSLGMMWHYVTCLYFGDRGYKRNLNNLGKTVGLAAFGKADKLIDKFRKYIDCKNLKLIVNQNLYKTSSFSIFTEDYLTFKDFKKYVGKVESYDIVAAAQQRLEEVVISLVANVVKKTNIKKIAVAGGVFANVILNKKIKESKIVDDIYVFPAMSDGGLALGAALYFYSKQKNKKTKRVFFDNIFFGPSYSKHEIEKNLRFKNINYRKSNNVSKETAKLLNRGKIIGVFSGRMEYGPRALGNRSILCSAADRKVKKILNQKLKRSSFMPFAPVTLEDYAESCYKDYVKGELSAKYMTMAYDCTEKMKDESPACVHIDGTARPQIINKKDNVFLYSIVNEYYKLCNIPTLINTSFNLHGEPIVCSPRDALRGFLEANLDYLVIDDFICQFSK
ncbi:MAG: carbamoyltransferase family protein [Promethearchaeota archaeon]